VGGVEQLRNGALARVTCTSVEHDRHDRQDDGQHEKLDA
jgi:hypothetical protein